MSDLLALLLTDIVDSTQVNVELGDAEMAAWWAEHDRAARALMQDWRGREVGRSDGFLVLFDTAADAVGFALGYHASLAAQRPAMQARVGLHVGPVQLRHNSADDVARGATPYEVDGLALPVAARVMSAALGGQTLLSAGALHALGPTPHRVLSHGHWRLKGLAEPIELLEIGGEGAPFVPPPDAPKAYRVVRDGDQWRPVRELPHTLPAERDAFIGRAEPLQSLATLIDAGARLVTLLGIGGIGKTRLALRYARGWLGEYPGGAWFCDLSSARSADGIVHAVAQGLELPLGKADPVQQIGAAIAGRGACLVILDNFEQVARYAEATLGAWIEAAARATFVATSRERLGLVGEQAFVIEPLSGSEAEAMFIERVRASGLREAYTALEAANIAPLVELLDRLPLAIELAAARARLMPPSALLRRMGERFQLLATRGGRRDRQATLRAALDWSWELLTTVEQSALVQLAVFESGFTLDAAQAVLDLPEGQWAPDLVQSLLEKSLLRRRGGERLDMLATVQHYLHERGEGHGDAWRALASQARRRHWQHFAGLAEDEATTGRGIEIDNLMAACSRATAARDDDAAVELLAHAAAVLRLAGPLSAIVTLAESVLAPAAPAAPLEAGALAAPLRARTLCIAGGALLLLGHIERSRTALREALAGLPEANRWRAMALCSLGELESMVGQAALAQPLLDEALNVSARCGELRQQCRALNALGALASEAARWGDARLHYQAGLRLARDAGHTRWEGLLLGNLGVLEHQLGKTDLAAQHYEHAVVLAEQCGDRRGEGDRRCNLGMLLLEQGQLVAARAELERASAIAAATGHVRLQGITQCNLGLALEAEGLPTMALAAFEVALATAADDPRAEGQYRVYVGRSLARLGRGADAGACLDRASTLLDEGSDPSIRCLLYCALAEGAIASLDMPRAEMALQHARDLQELFGAGPDSECGREVSSVLATLESRRQVASVSRD